MHGDHSEEATLADDIGTAILDAAFKVHRAFGPGLLEGAYEALLAHELEKQNHKVDRQLVLPVIFESRRVDLGYRLDMVIDDLVVVEVKASTSSRLSTRLNS